MNSLDTSCLLLCAALYRGYREDKWESIKYQFRIHWCKMLSTLCIF